MNGRWRQLSVLGDIPRGQDIPFHPYLMAIITSISQAISGGASGDRALLARLLFPLDGLVAQTQTDAPLIYARRQFQARTSDTTAQASLNIHDLPSHVCWYRCGETI